MAQSGRSLSSPKIPEPRWRQLCISDGVLNVFVAEIGLQRPRVMPVDREFVLTGMPEHVGVRLERKLGLDPCPLDRSSDTSGAEGCPSRTL